jgi:small conductance mechanosensitive channel
MALTVILFIAPVSAQDTREGDKPASKAEETATTQLTRPDAKPTDAERVIALERSIKDAIEERDKLRATLADPASEYAEAKESFAQLDAQRDEMQQQLEDLREAGDTAEAAKIEAELARVNKRWEVAKERLEVAVEERKTLETKLATLERKLTQDRTALEKLLKPSVPETQPARPAAEPSDEPPAQASSEEVTAAPEKPAPETPPSVTATPTAKPSKEVMEAEEKAKAKEAAAEQAERRFLDTEQRLATLSDEIESERKLLATARRKMEIAEQQVEARREELQKLWRENASRDTIEDMNQKVANAVRRADAAQADVELHADRVDELLVDLQQVQSERIADLEAAQEKRLKAEAARKEVERLKNPFARHNLARWFNKHAARVGFIIVAVVVLMLLVRIGQRYIILAMVGRAEHGTKEERMDRAQTLVSVFKRVAYFVLVVTGVLMILSEVGINMVPLLGGAAALSVAIGFGAQSLIKDYFTGFMILLEDQYGINDVVKIGGVAGLVERVGLRVTVLRDLEGTLHFIPNGQATVVSNLTHGWSRVVLDVQVGYREDVERVMEVLAEIGQEMRDVPEFGSLMIGSPEILGVDALGDWAVIIKLLVKTRPMKQWSVKREYLRRIKIRFDELGIEIPMPHRIIHHREGQPHGLPSDG